MSKTAAATVHSVPLAADGGLAEGLIAGRKCEECGAHAVIRKDGCEYCTACGNLGSCG